MWSRWIIDKGTDPDNYWRRTEIIGTQWLFRYAAIQKGRSSNYDYTSFGGAPWMYLFDGVDGQTYFFRPALLIKPVRDVAQGIGGRRQGDQKYPNGDQRSIKFRHWLLKRISLMVHMGFTCLGLPALRNYIMEVKGKLENPKHNLHLPLWQDLYRKERDSSTKIRWALSSMGKFFNCLHFGIVGLLNEEICP